jgi:nicotinamidase-related amidase
VTDDFEDHCWKDVIPQDTLDLYQAYKRKLYIGSRPAILAIDLYKLAYQGGARPVSVVAREHPASCGINAWNALEPTRRLLAAARGRNVPIFHTTVDTRPESKPRNIKATNRPISEKDLEFFEFQEEVAPRDGEIVIPKQRASGFFGTPLSAHLVQLGIDTVIVLGQTTSGCVRASTVDGFSQGFHMVMAEECCFDRSDISHKVCLFDLHHKYADVMRTAEIVGHLENTSVERAA